MKANIEWDDDARVMQTSDRATVPSLTASAYHGWIRHNRNSYQWHPSQASAGCIDIDSKIAPPGFTQDDWRPIPLTAFEAMMLLDDRPGFSMSCAAELHFDGALEREIFEAAYYQAIARHKLLCAVVARQGTRLVWRPTPTKPPIFWDHDNSHVEFARMRNFDLTRECGVRTWVNVDGDKSIIRFDFHHACCDAAGGMGSIEDLFAIYDALKNSREPKLRPLDDACLLGRDNIELGQLSLLAKLKRSCTDVTKSLRLLFTHPLPIPLSGGAGQPWTDRFIRRRIGEADLAGLRHTASNISVTLNDLMLLEFMYALRDWAQPQDGRLPSRAHIRVIAPMNLRDRGDAALSAANKIGFSFMSRSLADLRCASTNQWERAVLSVNAEMEKARRSRLPAQFLKKLAIARRSKRWFASFFSQDRCWATGILTQLGDPTRRFHHRFPRRHGRIVMGGLLLTEIAGCAPLRPLTRVQISMNTYGNELTLTMRCDPASIAQSVAEEFFDAFLQRLKQRSIRHSPSARDSI